MNIKKYQDITYTQIPTFFVGPYLINGSIIDKEEVMIPFATYETTIWPSANRGARVTYLSGGINTEVLSSNMTRSVSFKADSLNDCLNFEKWINSNFSKFKELCSSQSRFATLNSINCNIIGNNIFIRLEIDPADASGHNMVTKFAEHFVFYVKENYTDDKIKYLSLSGNFCTDKKVSAVNALNGRGKKCISECLIPQRIVERLLKTDVQKVVDLNINKNYLGSITSGSLLSANAHVANTLLATFLATGQDAANIVEGSQAITTMENINGDLYISTTIPNLIVGTVGNGKASEGIINNLDSLACRDAIEKSTNSKRLAAIISSAVLSTELSLLCALTNPAELMSGHLKYER